MTYEVQAWRAIKDAYEEAYMMPTTPKNIHPVPADYIFDREKSIRWNEEQALQHNRKYETERRRLTELQSEAIESVNLRMIKFIQEYTNCGLTTKQATRIFWYVKSLGHSEGINAIGSHLFEVVDLIYDLNHVTDDEDE